MRSRRVVYDDDNDDDQKAVAWFNARWQFHTCIALSVLAVIVFAVALGVALGVNRPTTPPATPSADAFTAWSNWCYELSPGVYRQTRHAKTAGICTSDEQRACVSSSCLIFTWNTIENLTCSYNATTNLCNGASWIIRSGSYCGTNATDFSHYMLSQTATAVTSRFGVSSQCIPECPLTNASNTPTPVPSPSACAYGNWSDWSQTCMETSSGVFQQSRFRYANHSSCTATREFQTCDLTSCLASTVYQLASTSCEYDAAGLCSASSYGRVLRYACATDALNLTAYLAVAGAGTVQASYLATTTCGSECPCTGASTVMPSPSIVPVGPIVCANTTDDLPWSVSCDEITPNVYRQWRRASDPLNAPSCPIYYDVRNCSLPSCMLYATRVGQYGCTYNTTTSLFIYAELYMLDVSRCITNSSNMTAYSDISNTQVPYNFSTPIGNSTTRPPECTPTSNVSYYISDLVNFTIWDITASLACIPPEYLDAATQTCELCEGNDACHIGFIDYQLGVCLQTFRCNDNNPCTEDVCTTTFNSTIGQCLFLPLAQNALNVTLQQICNNVTGVVNTKPLGNTTTTTLPSCNDNNNNTVDNYSTITQSCINTPIAPPVPPPQNTNECAAVTIDLATYLKTATSTTLGLTDFWRCGPDGTQVCSGGACVNPRNLNNGFCAYDLIVVDSFGRGTLGFRVEDDTVCHASAIIGAEFPVCNPRKCPNTRTRCAYCPHPAIQDALSFLASDALCQCCADDIDSGNDCFSGYKCVFGQCVKVPNLPQLG